MCARAHLATQISIKRINLHRAARINDNDGVRRAAFIYEAGANLRHEYLRKENCVAEENALGLDIVKVSVAPAIRYSTRTRARRIILRRINAKRTWLSKLGF